MIQQTLLTDNQSLVNQPSQPKFWQILRLLKSCLAMMVTENSLQPVIEMTDVLVDMPAQEEAAAYLKQDPDCAALIQARYIPPTHDLEQLLTLPADTLGYHYASAMKKTGFDPNLHAGMKAETDGQYVELRLSQTHDIWHVITGFDVSDIGE